MNMLSAREIAQILREAVSASRSTRRVTQATWDEINNGLMTVDMDGWVITLFNDFGELDYCDSCYSPDGRNYDFAPPDVPDPIELLTAREHRKLEELLRRI